jgi:uncharacterized protein YukE
MRLFKRLLAGILMLALLAVPVLIYFNAQALTDWWRLRAYSPPATVSNLATQDTMTAYARHVFYVNRPDIESDVNQFRTDCNENEKTIVLGCYHSNQEGIFVYNVIDTRLSGIEQVTAAHEMLHAAYDRLSTHERDYVDGLLQDYYQHDLKDQRIIDTMNAYRQTEPNDLVNEMHSVFGTEIADLPPSLVTYYAKYFTNRQTVTDFAASYQGEFTSRDSQIKADDARLAQLKSQINNEEQALNSQLSQINSDRVRLNNLRSSGQIDEYNSGVAGFNAEVNSYNNGVDKLRNDINTYNQLVSVRNSIASELASLDQSIDTRLVPQSTQ